MLKSLLSLWLPSWVNSNFTVMSPTSRYLLVNHSSRSIGSSGLPRNLADRVRRCSQHHLPWLSEVLVYERHRAHPGVEKICQYPPAGHPDKAPLPKKVCYWKCTQATRSSRKEPWADLLRHFLSALRHASVTGI